MECLTFGHGSRSEALSALRDRLAGDEPVKDWNPGLRKRLERYAAGRSDDFADVRTRETEGTDFASRVIRSVRSIAPGATLSYADVAALAGSPKAARAVGNIMARNPIPIIIPCHRVTGARGSLGGYSAPQGLDMKQRLLRLEQAGA
ncbi:MAG: MGMT family protein [Planctomyces sp.]|nr:MGMT family protein [Planctomyces sp.]